MPQKDTSACHNAPVSVRGGDEGTSYYVCGVCHKPCDIAPKSDMPDDGVREQIDEILWRQSCYPGSVGLSPSEVRDAIEALIAAAREQYEAELLDKYRLCYLCKSRGHLVKMGMQGRFRRYICQPCNHSKYKLRAQKEREA